MDMRNIFLNSSSGRKLEYLIMGWIAEWINAKPHVAKEGGKAERCRSGTELNRNNTGSSGMALNSWKLTALYARNRG